MCTSYAAERVGIAGYNDGRTFVIRFRLHTLQIIVQPNYRTWQARGTCELCNSASTHSAAEFSCCR
jgi:hypothetical protein